MTDVPDTDPQAPAPRKTISGDIRALRSEVHEIATEHSHRLDALEKDMACVQTTIAQWSVNIERFYQVTMPQLQRSADDLRVWVDELRTELREQRAVDREQDRQVMSAKLEAREAKLRPAKTGAAAGAGGAVLVEAITKAVEWLSK